MGQNLIQIIDNIVKQKLFSDKTGHDYSHAERVRKNGIYIAKENSKVDLEIVQISCLLHDIAYQNKMSFCEIERHNIIGAKQDKEILNETGLPRYKVQKISDADNLDALGSIGLIRMVNFCQSQGFPIFKSKKDG